jgi:pyruvate dehydrogenase E1 component
MKYMRERREQLGGFMPVRRDNAEALIVPGLEIFDSLLKDSGDREFSTTMAFVRMLSTLARDKNIGKNIVPIVPDEARTFGMEGMFRQLGIYAFEGQLYKPMDADQVMYYREDVAGQILEEGINEAGAMSSWIAAGSAYSTHGVNMIPFYIFYSMFGFQRIGDLAWAAGDMQVRGFLMGGTAGRTTLAGEGLQHQDGHSLIVASTIPNCISYDPTFAYELAVIIHSGLKRMYQMREKVFYYITVMNENYSHPSMPKGCEDGIIKGLYCLDEGDEKGPKLQLMGSGTILREVIAAADLLKRDFKVNADIWSATSVNELAREARDCARWNQLHPTKKTRQSYLATQLRGRQGPVVFASDYIRAYGEQLREYIWSRYVTLGTDGYGRSDTRDNLRTFFEVNRYYIVVAALKALADDGEVDSKVVQQAIKKYQIDPEKPNPVSV